MNWAQSLSWQDPTLILKSLIVILLTITAGWILYTRLFHPLSSIPGPFWASISRYWLAYQISTGKADTIQQGLHDKFGPVVRIAPDEVSIADPAALKTIYGINSGFTKTEFYAPFAPAISVHGDLFSQPDEKKHSARRRLVSSIYSVSSVLESEQYIDACTDVLLKKMAKLSAGGDVVDIGEWIQWYTFDVVGELFFGQQFGFMRDGRDVKGYILSLDTLMPTTVIICILPVFLRGLQSLFALPFPRIRSAIRAYDEIRQGARLLVAGRMQQMAKKQMRRPDLLDKLFKVQQKKSDFDILEIQSECCTALLAGSDTTAIAIRSILYYLMRSPRAYTKLMEEIDNADDDGGLSRPFITYGEAVQLPYLVACCKEGMRLHPSIGLSLPRHVPAGGRQIAGHFFPAGTTVGISAPVLHANKEIFGEDAATFNPDRWLRGPDAAAAMDRHMFHFGAGSRTCIGKNISLVEIYKVIPQILRAYRLELADPCKQWNTHNFWFHEQTGIEVRVHARRSSHPDVASSSDA